MINVEKLYKKFSDALPKDLELTEEKKKEVFDFIYKMCYTFIMEDGKDLFN